jgi:hypothetical protein
MSGVLMIGFFMLALSCSRFPYISQSEFRYTTELLLILAALSAGLLAWHLEKRCGSALYNLWLLASSEFEEK